MVEENAIKLEENNSPTEPANAPAIESAPTPALTKAPIETPAPAMANNENPQNEKQTAPTELTSKTPAKEEIEFEEPKLENKNQPAEKPVEEILDSVAAKPTIDEKIIKADKEPVKEDGQNTLDEELDLLADAPTIVSKEEKILTEENNSPTPQPETKIIGSEPDRPIIPLILSFLDKLKELRQKANAKRRENIEKNLKKIMAYAAETQKVTNNEVERLTGVSDRQALNYLSILVKRGDLVRFGKQKNNFYKPIKK